MSTLERDGTRDHWKQWAQHTFPSASETQVDYVTDALMQAVLSGSSTDGAVQAAQAAWSYATGPVPADAAAISQPEVTPSVGRPAPVSPSALSGPGATQVGQPAPHAGGVFGSITGRGAGFQPRNEQVGRRYVTVWDFHIERPEGPSVAVEIRGYSFAGAINNGDEVRVTGIRRSGGLIRPDKLENLTTNATVRVKSRPHPVARGIGTVLGVSLKLVFFLIFLAIVATIVLFIAKHGSLQ